MTDTDRSIGASFEDRVRLHPDRTAIQTGREEVSYAALNREANRLARKIATACEGRSDQVALLFQQSSWPAIAAMLGALKAGKTYVPLDPAYPPARTAYMLSHSESGAIVSGEGQLALAADLAKGDLPILPCDGAEDGADPGDPSDDVPAETAAYILYTSGSTGRPKGVVQTHRNLQHFVRSYVRHLGVEAGDRFTFFYSYCFSASLMDIYGALLHGGTLLPYDINREGMAGLSDWLVRERVTVFHSVPSLFRSFVTSLTPETRLTEIRAIDLGGEPVYRRDVERFKQHFSPPCVLVNHLACTEASVAAQYSITHDTEVPGALAPVGRDADGVEIRIVDEQGEEAAAGESGEIIVTSRYLSPGYWREDELTQRAFQPLDGGAGERSYRTGDLGRRRPDGLLEHLGRLDFRVKIRGHTIDVAEVEQALIELESIRSAAVSACDDDSGTPRLVAYATPASGKKPTGAQLRSCLARSLPDAMIPAAFVFLDELPLTATGKVDRSALPKPDLSLRSVETEFVAPRTEREALLARIWSGVLGVARVGINDSFFDLGGDSLLAIRALLEVERATGVRIAPSVLGEVPTIELLADRLFRLGAGTGGSSLKVVRLREGSRRPLFMVPPAAQTPLMFHNLARHLDPDQPLYSLNHRGMDDREAPHESVEAMAAYFIEAMREIQSEGPYLIGGMCFGGHLAFEMARQLRDAGADVGLLVILDTMAIPRPRPEIAQSAAHWNRSLPQRLWQRVRDGSIWPLLEEAVASRKRSHLEREFAHVSQAHKKARQDYRAARFDGTATLFRSGRKRNPTWEAAWESLCTGGVSVVEVRGGHGRGRANTFIQEPYVREVAAKLSTCLAEARTAEH